jgi:hypothetical protein
MWGQVIEKWGSSSGYSALLRLSIAFGGAQVNEIVHQQTAASKELDDVLEAYLTVEPPFVF